MDSFFKINSMSVNGTKKMCKSAPEGAVAVAHCYLYSVVVTAAPLFTFNK